MKTVSRAGALGLLCAALHAQNYTVSPASAASADANSSTQMPWSNPNHRYQQIHNDLRGPALLLRGLSFRRDRAGFGDARTIDAEIFMGDADYANATTSFLGNYTGQRLRVVNRRQLNLPHLPVSQGPDLFTLVIPFDLPFPYRGTQDLAWELVVHSTVFGRYVLDGHSGRVGIAHTSVGKGCTVQGNSLSMILGTTSDVTIEVLRLGWTAVFCPADAPSVVVVGLTNPNLTVPGLCTNLYVAPLLVIPALAVGDRFTIPTAVVPFDPSLAGGTFHTQAFSHDPAQSGIPISGSQGVQSTIGSPPPFRIARVWADDVNAASGTHERLIGIVVRFTHQ